MNLELAPADEAFRQEVRTFLDVKLTSDLRQRTTREGGVFSEGDTAREWQRILFDKGWVAPTWPAEFGGSGWDVVRRYIWNHESAAAGAPVLPAMGLQMCGPVLMRYGDIKTRSATRQSIGAEAELVGFFVSRYFGLKAYSTIFGVCFSALLLGTGLNPLLYGMVHDITGTYDVALSIATAGALLAAVLFGTLGRYRYAVKGR